MKYYSTNRKSPLANFQDAIFKGLPDDNGLYMPDNISPFPPAFFDQLEDYSLGELGFKVLEQFVGDEIPPDILFELINDTLSFDVPLKEVSEDIYSLELYHGPTFAFKDVGARFLARCLSYFTKQTQKELTVLVATSGDTGSAVAQGFYEVPNIEVIILYPSGKISEFQEQQMTTLGKNITALEVDGTFDDCQRMVKQAFLDKELSAKAKLTSANSINIARLLPQSIYYFYALAQLPKEQRENVIVSVPSGNYGNLTAGLIAQKMGLPISHFLACSNVNDTVPKYLETAEYIAKPSIQTISNAMDVGAPSNFARMLDLFSGSHEKMSSSISGYSFTDHETQIAIQTLYNHSGYILDPHGAVGYLGLKNYLKHRSGPGIFLETAHPYKFRETVEEEINKSLDPILEFQDRQNRSIPFGTNFEELKKLLMES